MWRRRITLNQSDQINVALQYQAANDRRSKNFEFFWQAVALSLAAQAFLMTISMGSHTSYLGRYFSSGLSILVSYAAIALMISQRRYQKIEARWLDYFEATNPSAVEMLHGSKSSERYKQLEALERQFRSSKRPKYLKATGKSKLIEGPGNAITAFLTDATAIWALLMVAFIVIDGTIIGLTAANANLLR